MVRQALIRSIPAFVALIAGILLSTLGESSIVLFVAGMALIGLGGVALASLFFYEVGRSEDRVRAREQRR